MGSLSSRASPCSQGCSFSFFLNISAGEIYVYLKAYVLINSNNYTVLFIGP